MTDDDASNDLIRFMDIRETHLGMVPVIIGRVSYTGDLGYEIWVAAEYQRRLCDEIMAAGQDHDIRLFGSRAKRPAWKNFVVGRGISSSLW